MCPNGVPNGGDSPPSTTSSCGTGASGGVVAVPSSSGCSASANNNDRADYDVDCKLRHIGDDLRELMPLNAILPTEHITFPSVGEVSEPSIFPFSFLVISMLLSSYSIITVEYLDFLITISLKFIEFYFFYSTEC